MTLFISVFAGIVTIAVGLNCAQVETRAVPVARQIVHLHRTSRNTPLLVQLLYFENPPNWRWWSETCAIVGLDGGSWHAVLE